MRELFSYHLEGLDVLFVQALISILNGDNSVAVATAPRLAPTCCVENPSYEEYPSLTRR